MDLQVIDVLAKHGLITRWLHMSNMREVIFQPWPLLWFLWFCVKH
jgi:hypothetical protein